jgi:DNA-binding NtrC family response regulator
MTMDSTLKNKTVLIVDDEPDMRMALVLDMKQKGCAVFEAANGTEAMQFILNNQIDFVISDTRMPNGDGVELLKNIRKHNADVAVLLLATGFTDLSEPEALRLGADAFLEKPIDRRKMLRLIAALIV